MSGVAGEPVLPRLSLTRPSTEAAPSSERVATFEHLFEREHPMVVRMAYLMLGRTGEAEEVAQEAFTELLVRWGRIDNPAGFVRTVAVNRCRDIGRRRSVRDRALRRMRPRGEPVIGDYLVDALQQLDLQLRELVVLRYYAGHTVPEIASIVGTPEGTVKSRLHRALAQLGELLGEE
ncbi:MAG: sigma-70 family RNA polymerase sigma factor [Actinomycetota bacterium]|nr:sigma-70 family RNA polymerase sigma factor [Actinomycetota bacterium]